MFNFNSTKFPSSAPSKSKLPQPPSLQLGQQDQHHHKTLRRRVGTIISNLTNHSSASSFTSTPSTSILPPQDALLPIHSPTFSHHNPPLITPATPIHTRIDLDQLSSNKHYLSRQTSHTKSFSANSLNFFFKKSKPHPPALLKVDHAPSSLKSSSFLPFLNPNNSIDNMINSIQPRRSHSTPRPSHPYHYRRVSESQERLNSDFSLLLQAREIRSSLEHDFLSSTTDSAPDLGSDGTSPMESLEEMIQYHYRNNDPVSLFPPRRGYSPVIHHRNHHMRSFSEQSPLRIHRQSSDLPSSTGMTSMIQAAPKKAVSLNTSTVSQSDQSSYSSESVEEIIQDDLAQQSFDPFSQIVHVSRSSNSQTSPSPSSSSTVKGFRQNFLSKSPSRWSLNQDPSNLNPACPKLSHSASMGSLNDPSLREQVSQRFKDNISRPFRRRP